MYPDLACRLLFFLSIFITGVAFFTQAYAAAPRLLMFYGKLLPRPIILDDWQENMQLMETSTAGWGVAPAAHSDRPFIEMAFFWGPEWIQYVREGKPIEALRPEQGNQHAYFYPAFDGNAALFAGLPIKSEGLRLLAEHGIPVRVEILPSGEVRPVMPTRGKSEEEILNLEQEWEQVYSHTPHDLAVLEHILANDYAGTNFDGARITKASAIALAKNPHLSLDSFKVYDRHVRVFGDTAIVDGRYTVKGQLRAQPPVTRNDRDLSGTYRCTHLYLKREGQWQMISSQETLVAEW